MFERKPALTPAKLWVPPSERLWQTRLTLPALQVIIRRLTNTWPQGPLHAFRGTRFAALRAQDKLDGAPGRVDIRDGQPTSSFGAFSGRALIVTVNGRLADVIDRAS